MKKLVKKLNTRSKKHELLKRLKQPVMKKTYTILMIIKNQQIKLKARTGKLMGSVLKVTGIQIIDEGNQ